MTSRGVKGLRANTITQALDIAKQNGKLEQEVSKMKDVVSTLSNPDEDKAELNSIIDSAAEMVSKTNLSDISNASARHQIFSLGHFAKTLRGEIEQTSIEGVLPKELEDLNALKIVRQKQRLDEVGRAIQDINKTNNTVDLNNYRIFDVLKELPPASQETIQAEEKKKGLLDTVKETIGKGVEAVKGIFETKEEPIINTEEQVKDAIAEQRRLRDAEIAQIQAIRTDLGSDAELFDDMPDIVDKTIDRIDMNIPVDPVQIEESITALDNQFKKLKAYRNSPNRTHTTEQIDSVIDILSEAKSEIQNFQLKQVNYEKQSKPTETARKSEVTPIEEVAGKETTTEKVGTLEPIQEKTTTTPEVISTEEIQSEQKPLDEKAFEEKENVIKEYYSDWSHALNSYNKRKKFLGEQTVERTKEQFMQIPTEEFIQASKLSESSAAYQESKKTEVKKTTEPEGTNDTLELSALDQINDLMNIQNQLTDEQKAELDNILNTSALFQDLNNTKKKKQLSSEKQRIVDNPELFNNILSELKRMYPSIPVEVLENLATDEGITLLGQLSEDGIQINKNEARQDTILHEFSHLIVPLIKNSNIYKNGTELIKKTKYYSEAKERYPNYNEEELLEEALIQLVGEQSLDVITTKLDGTTIEKILDWLKFFWNRLKAVLGTAKAEDIANIIAMKLAYNKIPNVDKSLLIGRKEQQISYEQDKGFNIVRNSFILTALAYKKDKGKLKGNIQFTKAVFRDVLFNLSSAAYPKLSLQEFVEKNQTYVLNALNHLNGIVLEDFVADSYYDKLTDEEKDKFIDDTLDTIEKDDIDANVRDILNLLYSYEGYKIDANHIYGIVSAINTNTKSKSGFLERLKERAELDHANVNKVIAKHLYNALITLPDSIANPVIEQLKNIKKINFLKLSVTEKSIETKESFKLFTPKQLIKSIVDNFILNKSVADVNDVAKAIRKNAIQNIEIEVNAIKKAFKQKLDRQKLSKSFLSLQQSIRVLTKYDITPDMFVSGKLDKNNIDTSKQNAQLAYIQFAEALLSNDYRTIRNSLRTAAYNYKSNLADTSMFKNVLGNLQRAYRIPGLLHKFFTDTFSDSNATKKAESLPMFKGLKSIDLGKIYSEHFQKLTDTFIPIISHTDGFEYLENDKAIAKDWSAIHKDDEAFWHFSQFLNGYLFSDSYNQTLGVLGARDFQALINVPILRDANKLVNLLEEIKSKYNPQLIGKVIPTIEQVQKDKEYLIKVYNQLPQEIKNSIKNKIIEQIDKVAENKAELENENLVLNKIFTLYVLNDAIHRIHTSQFVTGNLNNIQTDKNGNLKIDEREKRGAGMTSPVPSLYLGNKKAKIFVVKDIAKGASNSQSFCNDFVAEKIQQSGGALIDYKNFFKPRLNDIIDGDLIDIKTTTIAFKGRTQEDIEAQDKVKADINLALKNLSENNPNTPIFIVFDSAIKSKLPNTIYDLNDLINNSSNPNLEASYSFVPKNFGVQFNINKDVSSEEEETSLSTQLLKIAPHQPQYVQRIESKLSEITNLKQKQAKKYLENKNKVISDVEKFSRLNNKSLGTRILELIKGKQETGIDKVDHYDIYHKVQSYISSVFTKTTKYKLPGAKLSQSVCYDDSLTWMEKSKDKIKPATVKVPKGFAEIGDRLILSRIPNSDFMTNIVATVSGFTEEGNNVVEVAPEWIYQSNADNDGDTLFTIKLNKTPKSRIELLENEVFEDLWEMMTDSKVWDRYQQELDVENLKKAIDTTNKSTNYNVQFKHIGGIEGLVQKSASLKESSRLIGAFAVGSKVNDILTLANVKLTKPIKVFAKSADSFTSKSKAFAAEFLQLALDDTKENRMHETGIIRENVGVVNVLLGLGYSDVEIMEFLKCEPISDIRNMFLNNRKVFGSLLDIKQASKAKYENNVEKTFNGTTYRDIVNQFWSIYDESMRLAPLTSVVQLDAKMPSNLIELNNILRSYDKLGKINYLNFQNVLNRPLMITYKETLNTLKEVYNNYSNLNDNSEEFGRTLASLEIDTTKKSDLVSKTATAYIAQKTSKLNFQSKESAMFYFNSFINKIFADVNPIAVYNSLSDENEIDSDFTIDDAQELIYDWFKLVRINPDNMSIVPNGLINTDAGINVDKEQITELFNQLPQDIQNNLIEYAIYQNGLMKGSNNITDLLPDYVFENYIEASKDFKMNEDFYDALVIDNISSVKLLPSALSYGINPNENRTQIKLKQELKGFKYFKVENATTKSKLLYKVDVENQVANLIYESKYNPNIPVQVKKTYTPFALEKQNASEISEVGDFKIVGKQVIKFVKENEDLSNSKYLFNTISKSSGNIKGNGSEQFQVSDNISKSIQGLKRILRRLSSKFGVQFEIINDPNQKFAGAFDRKNNKVIINEAYVKSDTPFHEFAHPFINVIKDSNIELYNSLINELKLSEDGKEILKYVKEKYSNLSEEEQEMEALVELLGRTADNKIKSKTLLEKAKDLLVWIANEIKSLFGLSADVIPSELNPNMKISELANILINDQNINLDVQNDKKVKNIISKSYDAIRSAVNNVYDVIKANDVYSVEQKNVISKLTKSGFLVNSGFIIKDKSNKFEKPTLQFRVPNNMKDWFSVLKQDYPKASLLAKKYSAYSNYKKYEVALGNNETVIFYAPIDDNAGTFTEIGAMHIQYQMANSNNSTRQNINNNKNVFDGVEFDTNVNQIKDIQTSVGYNKIRQRLIIETKAAYDLFDIDNYDTAPPELKKAIEDKINKIAKDIVLKTQQRFSELKGDRQSGDISAFVDLNFNTDIAQQIANLLLGKQSVADENVLIEFKRFLDAYSVLNHLYNTKDTYLFLDDNTVKGVDNTQVNLDIESKINQETNKRTNFFGTHKSLGNLFRKIISNQFGKEYLYGSLLPKVFAKIINGKQDGFFSSLIYKAFKVGEEKHFLYQEKLHDLVRNIWTDKSKMSSDLAEISTIMKKDESELKTFDVTLNAKTFKVPVGRAIELYKMLNQDHVQKNYVRYTKDGKKYFVVNFGDIDLKSTSSDVLQSNEEYSIGYDEWIDFKNKFESSEYNKYAVGLSNVFRESGKMISPVMEAHLGIGLELDADYYPITTGKKSSIEERLNTKRIEDFRFLKQRAVSLENKPSLRISDAFETTEYFIRESSNYYGYAIPVSNMRKLISSLDKKPEHKPIVDYLAQLNTDIQDYSLLGGVTDTKLNKYIQSFLNNFQIAVLGLNPSVAIKQSISIVPAAIHFGNVIFDKKYINIGKEIAGDVTNVKFGKDWSVGKLDINHPLIKEAMELSPMLRQRVKGYLDREQGEMRHHEMNPYSDEGTKKKFIGIDVDPTKFMEWIKIMDIATVMMIYARAKDEINEKYPNETAENKKELIKERFEQVTNDTQPTYGIIERTPLGRSKNLLVRLFTLFSSQRSKNANMLIEAYNEYATDPEDEQAKKKLKATLIMVGGVNSLGVAVIDKIKYVLMGNSDDEDVITDVAKMSIVNLMSNFYGAGEVTGAVLTGKPWYKVNHPIYSTYNLASESLTNVSDGKFVKGLDQAMTVALEVKGIPIFPYKNLVSKPIKAVIE